MKQTLFILLLPLFIANNANAQGWQWATSATCSGPVSLTPHGSEGLLAITDFSNNVYIAGYNFGNIICLGTYSFSNTVDNFQTVIAKYDTLGNVIWAQASGLGETLPTGITTDASGNLYFLGYYSTDSIIFGTHVLINDSFYSTNFCNSNCYFIVKFDANGNIIWIKNGCSINTVSGHNFHPGGIALDQSDNIYITGSFCTPSIKIGLYTLLNTNSSTNDIFIAKYDSSGNIIWAKSYGGADNDRANSISIGNDNKIYLAGNFESPTINFGSSTLTHSGSFLHGDNMFLVKLDTSGISVWAKNTLGNTYLNTLKIDNADDIYVGGYIGDSVITIGTTTYHNTGSDAFLFKYDVDGNIIWSKLIGTVLPASIPNYETEIFGVTTDICNNVWISGKLSANTFLDSVTILDTVSGHDRLFFVGYTSGGSLFDYLSLPSGGDDNSSIAGDKLGNVYLCGDYYSVDPFTFTIINPVTGDTTYDMLHLYSGEEENIFVAKYKPHLGCSGSENSYVISLIPEINLYPNPTNNELTISATEKINSIVVSNFLGQVVFSQQYNAQQVQIDVANLPSGVYFIKVNGSEVRKFVKQ